MGRPRKNAPGECYGLWTLINPADRKHWLCKCECGTEKVVRTDSLTSGKTHSCGCDAKRLQRNAKISQGPKKNLVGRRFGRLMVLSYAGNSTWNCVCDCGRTSVVHTGALNFGTSQSCGCKAVETRLTTERVTTHGMSAKKIYGVWRGMKQRCGTQILLRTSGMVAEAFEFAKTGATVLKRFMTTFADYRATENLE